MVDDPGSQGKCGNRTERLCGTVRIGRSLPLGVQKAPLRIQKQSGSQ